MRLSILCVLLVPSFSLAGLAQEIPPIARRLPPAGTAVTATDRQQLGRALRALQDRAARELNDHRLAADVEVFLKAVDYALRHDEFYVAADVRKARRALDEAQRRLDAIGQQTVDWTGARGLVVRGYHSRIDGSPQPYGLVIPESLDLAKPVPLVVWLHGRGDKVTDLHFISSRLKSRGNVAPDNAMVLHPFGRQCVGFKSAGEIDVLEAVESVKSRYAIDPDRVVLMGFSMGGAGAWHLGAHYADRWVAMSPGAGFAETAQYNRLTPEQYPPGYEQTLWGLYDVPCYVRNLFNLPVVAYSGEEDRQIQAARVMEHAFADNQRTLTHLIGPGMGHQYHPDTLHEIIERMQAAVTAGRNTQPDRVYLQTRTLRYHRQHWVDVRRLVRHWEDTRVDAERTGPRNLRIQTDNVARLRVSPWTNMEGTTVEIDGQTVPVTRPVADLSRDANGMWSESVKSDNQLIKSPGLQGPIDDAFLDAFLVVRPTARPSHDAVARWVEFEIKHLEDRWRSVFRGELPIKSADQVTPEDIENRHLILFGDPKSNPWIQRVIDRQVTARVPLDWNARTLALGGRTVDARTHVPAMIYPNPLNPKRYVVLNSGPTFREAHDRTNSLQNPKLPDWAIIDLSTPPSDTSPGRIVVADFFNESWQ